jgi:2-keto-4-pentenoate hydratase/2-oxohepta-3-ene-1,7-dioic acid hydratase in catechol pathway
MTLPSVDRLYRVPAAAGPRYALERDGRWHWLDGDPFGLYRRGDEIAAPASLLAPVAPSKIVAIGLNYRHHAAEMNKPLPDEPLMFLKPSTAVIGPGAPVWIPPGVGRVDYEAEVAIVIGRPAFRVAASHASEYILGITCMNDVTARAIQRKEMRYTRAKGFDTFAPLGPCVAVGLDGSAVDVEGWVNGERRQASNTRDLIFDIPTLVEFVTFVMTLQPGDVIATGTPKGVGPLTAGDEVVVKVEGVGTLRNVVEWREGEDAPEAGPRPVNTLWGQ